MSTAKKDTGKSQSTRPTSVKSADTARIPDYGNNRTYILQPRPRSGPRSDPGPKRGKPEISQGKAKKPVEIVFEAAVKPKVGPEPQRLTPKERQRVPAQSVTGFVNQIPKPTSSSGSPVKNAGLGEMGKRMPGSMQATSMSKIFGDSSGSSHAPLRDATEVRMRPNEPLNAGKRLEKLPDILVPPDSVRGKLNASPRQDSAGRGGTALEHDGSSLSNR